MKKSKKENKFLRKKLGFKEPWIGVDLDGTLTYLHNWNGYNHIGKPVPKMMKRLKEMIAAGKKVKIFSSRAEVGLKGIKPIQEWLIKYGLPPLEVTNVKDSGMMELWDDLAIKVEVNTGKTCCRYKKNWKMKIVY